MKPKINFYLKDETLHYLIKKSFGKVIFQNNQNVLLFEVESTDDLDHVEGDSLQNEYPEIVLSIEDFPVHCAHIEELLDNTLTIPLSVGEIENEEGESEEVYYTNLNLNDEIDLETNENMIRILKGDDEQLYLEWKGKCEHFQDENETINFEILSKIEFNLDSPNLLSI